MGCPIEPVNSSMSRGLLATAGRGLGQAIGLNQRPSGEFAPFLRNRPLHRHASGKGKPKAGEVEPAEVRVLHQSVEQRIDANDYGERMPFQLPDQPFNIARVGYQHVRGADLEKDQGHRQGEDVVEGERRDEGFSAFPENPL